MSGKKQRLKHTPGQRCREESIRAESAGRKGRIALWKIAVPVIIVLFLLHCRAWHPEEAWLLRTAFSTGSYRSLNAVVASVLFVIGMGGRMLYVYLCCGRDEKKGVRRLGRNMLYGLFWGAGLSALCTNVVVVSLFWLNACFTSADKTCDYRIIAAKVHDRRPKSRFSRYSASWLLNTFSYGELFVEGDRYTCVNVSPRMARQFEGSERVYLKIDLADGWLGWGVVCLNQEEYEGKMRYSKEALKAALRMDNLFYKNLALCDIATGYYFLNRLDSALYYAQAAYDAAIADSLPSQLPHVYTDLGSIYAKMGENGKALEYIDKAIGLRPRKDTLAILGLYADKVDLFGKLGQYDSAYHYFRKAVASPNLATQADAYNHMSGAYYKMGRCNEAYSLLLRFTELADSVRKQRHTAEVIALQELYKHEQLSVENLYWRTQAAEMQSNVYLMATLSLLSLWIASTIYFFYWRNRRRLVEQQHQLASQQEELHHQRQVTTENLQRMAEMEQKEARLKETFFRRLNQRIVQEIEKGSNILLSDDDWEDIVQNADIIFDNFTRRLQQHYPALNKEDLRYCCMVKMQLSQLEMSQIMHLEKDSVKKRLKRIRMEKMKADSGVTLEELLRRF